MKIIHIRSWYSHLPGFSSHAANLTTSDSPDTNGLLTNQIKHNGTKIILKFEQFFLKNINIFFVNSSDCSRILWKNE